ncbi:cation:dicarboxylate symporter family transporter [Glutamicibacter arilaitensis]|uniref:cation:dicarboxylate symporter family transporter n=1 Tax=Glutamicibacter arilaitensis TaxID=256701 RepID=UPI003FD6A5E5
MPVWLGSLFLTYNSIFSGFLGFIVPLIIFGLVAPAIAELGKGAGKWLGITALIAYTSTLWLACWLTSSAAGSSPSRCPVAAWKKSAEAKAPASHRISRWSAKLAMAPPKSC